jgi:hypothetical protein
MDDDAIHERISELVDAEHQLRRRLADGSGATPEERERLDRLEVQLDQAWDLLRQREALRNAGEDPDDAAARPASEVEGYQQ